MKQFKRFGLIAVTLLLTVTMAFAAKPNIHILATGGTIAAKQLSFFGGNILVRLLTHLLKFPADGDFFSPVLIFCLAADRTVRTVRAVFAAVKQKTRVVKPFG